MDTTYDGQLVKAPSAWGAVTCLSLLTFVLVASEFMPVSLLTPIANELAISEGQAGQAISVSGFFAVLTSLAMMGARALSDIQPAAVLTVVAALALSVAVASGMADTGPGPSPYFAAGLIALGVSAVRVSGSDGA